jgi:diaminopimelate decarboxylase
MLEQALSHQWHVRMKELGFEVSTPTREGTKGSLLFAVPSEREGDVNEGPLEACMEGIPLSSLLDEYGSPLLIVSERTCKDVVGTLRNLTASLGVSLRPALRFGPGALNDATCARVFSPVAASPTQELLRRLDRWNVGFLAQSAGELERALRAGAKASNVILCGAFKSVTDVVAAAGLGVRAVEVESFAEFEDLCSDEVRMAVRVRPLRLCLRVEVPWTPVPSGLRADEILVAFERVRHLDHAVCVGLSAGWRESSACTEEQYDAILRQLRSLAMNLISSGHPVESVMVGPRSHLHIESRADGTMEGESYMRLTREHFQDAPFRVYFSCGDAVFHRSTHKIGRVLRVSKGALGRDTCYVDIRYPEGWRQTDPLLPLASPGPRPDEGDLVVPPISFVGRSSFDHQPLKFGEWVWPHVRPGLPIILPRVGAAFAASASASCSVPRPTELLVTEEGDVVVIRSRDSLDGAMFNEV